MTSSRLSILITGGTGFLGSRLAAHFLGCGHRVMAPIRDSSNLGELDKLGITRRVELPRLAIDYSNIPAIVSESRIDVVVHVAAVAEAQDSHADTQRMIASNILLPSLFLSAMKAKGIRPFINTGTSWQSAEQDGFRPFNLYAATKEAFEQILAYYVEVGMSAVTLRLFDVYGPADPRPRLTNLLLATSASGNPLDMSPGEQKIDLVHVDDVCRAYQCAISYVLEESPATHRVFGVSGGNPIRLRELVDLFERVRGVKCNINWGKRPYRDREVMEPYKGYESLPGWHPQVKLEDGLRRLHFSAGEPAVD